MKKSVKDLSVGDVFSTSNGGRNYVVESVRTLNGWSAIVYRVNGVRSEYVTPALTDVEVVE